jgi:hypothetical protein
LPDLPAMQFGRVAGLFLLRAGVSVACLAIAATACAFYYQQHE